MISQSNIAGLIGARVEDSAGEKIGSIEQIFVDPTSARPNWATVKTGLFGLSETFIPLDDASEIGGVVRVPYEKAFIKHAPRIDSDGELSHEAEQELYAYYDRGVPVAEPVVPVEPAVSVEPAEPVEPAVRVEPDAPRLRRVESTPDGPRGRHRLDPEQPPAETHV